MPGGGTRVTIIMANTIYIGVQIERVFGQFCYHPSVRNYYNASVQKVCRFVSNVDALPGNYTYNLTSPNGDVWVASMVVGVGGIITGVVTPQSIEPIWYAGGFQPAVVGIGTHEVVVTYGFQDLAVHYNSSVVVTSPPDCDISWNQQTLTDSTVFNDYEVPISKPSGSNGGAAMVSPGQYTVKGFKAKGSYQADWVGGGIDPPGPQLGVVTFSFYPVNSSGVPIIPEEDKTPVPVELNNGSGLPILVCIGNQCYDLDPGEDLPVDWLTYGGDPNQDVIITFPTCPLCAPIIIPAPVWDPYDPGDPTNCNPAPGVTCPVFQIYIPPPVTNPDPEPEPEPEPEGGSGNEGNFQGCIQVPCEIPYLYTYESK
jgi:hypothetical protein